MPQPSEMSDDDFIKSIGGTPPTGKPTPAAPAGGDAATTGEAAPETISRDEQARQRIEGDWQLRAGRGVAKMAAGIPVGLGRLAGTISPGLAELTERAKETYPRLGRTAKELAAFADEPLQSKMEALGYGGGVLGTAAAVPGVGAERLAATAGARIFPPVFTRGAGFVPSAGQRVMHGAGRAIDAAARGAVGGAIGSPEDPATGAIGGAALGTAPGALGRLAQSAYGRYYGAHALPYAAAHNAYHLATSFGIPYEAAIGLYPLLKWYHSPAAGPLRRVGETLIDATGKTVATIPPALMGYFGGQQAGQVAREVGRTAADVAEQSYGEQPRPGEP